MIKRKKNARRYVYSEPSSTIVRKKSRRYIDGGTTVVRRDRPSTSVDVGVRSRTSVRQQSGASVNVRGSTTTRSSTTTSGERTSGQNGTMRRNQGQGGGASGGMESRSTSGQSGGASGQSGGSSGNQQQR